MPGFWLGAESWADVASHLTRFGIDHVALTLPGLALDAPDPGSVRLADHIVAVRDAIDSSNDEVVLVGHSGAGPICHAAASQRPAKVRHVVHVDTHPLAPGLSINAELAGEANLIALPAWSDFEPEDLVDMDDAMRNRLVSESRPQPAAIARDPFPPMSDDRFGIPTTVVCCEFTSQQLRRWMSTGDERLAELSQLADVAYVDLPTGHWSQFTKPAELAALLADLA